MPTHRTLRLLGAASSALAALAVVLARPQSVRAQLGAAPQTLNRDGTLKMHDPGPRNRFVELKFMESTAVYDERATGLRYFLGFRDGKVVYAQLSRVIPDQPLTPADTAAILKQFRVFDDRQVARSPALLSYTRLADLYPPLGNVRGELIEMMRRTGIQVQTVTTTRFSNGNLKVDFSGWNEVLRGTNVFLPEVVTRFGYRLILESRDGGVMAYLDVNYRRVDSPNPGESSQSRLGPNYIIFMTPKVFWEHLLCEEIDGPPNWSSSYRSLMAGVFPVEGAERMCRRRAALALVRYAELSAEPHEEVLARYRSLLQSDPAAESDVAELLLNSNFAKLGNAAMERHYRLAGDVGEPTLLEEFVKKMPKSGDGKALAAAALAKIAERHQLPAPPAVDASLTAWTTWAAQAGRKK